MKHLKYTLALLLCSSILAQTLAPQAQAISISEAFATRRLPLRLRGPLRSMRRPEKEKAYLTR